MSEHLQDVLMALFLTSLSAHQMWKIVMRKPLLSLVNARSLTFAAGLLAGCIFFGTDF